MRKEFMAGFIFTTLIVSIGIGVGIGVRLGRAELGIAASGGLFGMISVMQMLLVWLFK